MRQLSIGRCIMLALWMIVVLINAEMPWDINEYIEVVILFVALLSIEVLGEAIERKLKKSRQS